MQRQKKHKRICKDKKNIEMFPYYLFPLVRLWLQREWMDTVVSILVAACNQPTV